MRVFVWTENDSKTLRVTAFFFKTERKISFYFQTKTDMCGLDWIGLHQKGVVPHFNSKIKETESSNYYVSFIKPDELFNMFEKVKKYLTFKWILNG